MSDPIVERLHMVSPLSDLSRENLSAIVKRKDVKKGAHLVRIGKEVTDFFFIAYGLARVYYVRNGEDVTDYFACDGDFIGAVPALFTGGRSNKAVETLEDSEVYHFSYAEFERLCLENHDIERAGRRLAVLAFLDVQQRIEDMRFLSARERYELLETRHPGITNRLPLRHVASYLGTTNVSISRIRAGKQ